MGCIVPVFCQMYETEPRTRVLASETSQLEEFLPKLAHEKGVTVGDDGFG